MTVSPRCGPSVDSSRHAVPRCTPAAPDRHLQAVQGRHQPQLWRLQAAGGQRESLLASSHALTQCLMSYRRVRRTEWLAARWVHLLCCAAVHRTRAPPHPTPQSHVLCCSTLPTSPGRLGTSHSNTWRTTGRAPGRPSAPLTSLAVHTSDPRMRTWWPCRSSVASLRNLGRQQPRAWAA